MCGYLREFLSWSQCFDNYAGQQLCCAKFQKAQFQCCSVNNLKTVKQLKLNYCFAKECSSNNWFLPAETATDWYSQPEPLPVPPLILTLSLTGKDNHTSLSEMNCFQGSWKIWMWWWSHKGETLKATWFERRWKCVCKKKKQVDDTLHNDKGQSAARNLGTICEKKSCRKLN